MDDKIKCKICGKEIYNVEACTIKSDLVCPKCFFKEYSEGKVKEYEESGLDFVN